MRPTGNARWHSPEKGLTHIRIGSHAEFERRAGVSRKLFFRMKTKLEIIPGPYRVCEEKHDNGTLIIRSDPRGAGDVPGNLVVALIVGGAPEPYDRNTAALLAAATDLLAALQACVATIETAFDYGDFKGDFARIAERDMKAGIAALHKATAAPSNVQSEP